MFAHRGYVSHIASRLSVSLSSRVALASLHQGLRALAGAPGFAVLGGCDKGLRVWNYTKPDECRVLGTRV